MMNTKESRTNALCGAFVFLVAMTVYALCVTPTVPYWDSGEYIATSYILGVPHPPGTPLYVLIGRLFSLLPLGTIAVRVNLLSGFSSALAVLFTYLITVRLIRRSFGSVGWLAYAGGITAAFFMAFSPTFWDNAIEAEVYGSASTIMTLCVWLGLLWWERQGQQMNDRILWLILYILFLAIGIHLGTFLVFPCIYLLVTMVHWDRVKKGAFWGSIGLFVAGQLMYTALIMNAHGQYNITELSIAPESVRNTAQVFQLIMAAAIVWNMTSVLGGRFVAGVAVLAVIGVSVHLYLLIRARLDPGINEGDPSTWEALKLLLVRDQYKPPEPIFRKAPLWYQFDHMYLRYFAQQFHLFEWNRLPTQLLPILLGVFGAWSMAIREKKSFFLMLTLFLITGPFLVWYLNFREGEVRERDYFFVANFHFFAIWIGIGAAALAVTLREKLAASGAEDRVPPVAAATALLLVLVSLLPLVAGGGNDNYRRHNRAGNYVAHGYAYNMLVGLDPDAMIFTNGDNDTFPLWYIQEVEKFRTDVRVVNLSLLQTAWYIKQLRDIEPKVPIRMTDAEVDKLQPFRDQTGRVRYVNDIMIEHILAENDYRRPVYVAVTVPGQLGLQDRLKMEGLVFRVYRDKVDTGVDIAKMQENLDGKYQYKGFLDAAGNYDDSVYKDDQATKLLQNYAAARIQLAMELHRTGRTGEAVQELDKMARYVHHFEGVSTALGVAYERMGHTDAAIGYYQQLLARDPDNAEFLGSLGHAQAVSGDTAAAIVNLKRSIEIDPSGDFNPYIELVNIGQNRKDNATVVALLEQWLSYHPDDTRVRQFLESIRTTR